MLLAALLKADAETVTAAAAAAKKAAQVVFDATDTTQSKPRLPGGGPELATVYLTGGSEAQLGVTDLETFTQWVTENFPDEVMPVVRTPFRDQLLKEIREKGEAVTRAGEKVPGIGMLPGSAGTVAVKLRGDAAGQVDRARREGLLPPLAELLHAAGTDDAGSTGDSEPEPDGPETGDPG
jgi:hypothetical protein